MSFAAHLAQLMAGYDISDEEYDRLMDAAQAKERDKISQRELEAEWKRQWERERERQYYQQLEIETYGHVLAEFYEGMPYVTYLDTHRWRGTARFIKFRDDQQCRVCQSGDKLHVHHRTYAHIYDEMSHPDDLITLCQRCHNAHHDKIINIETLLNLPSVGRSV